MSYRRHRQTCSHRRKGRRYAKCQCPIWIDVRKNGARIHRATKLTKLKKADAIEEALLEGSAENIEEILAPQEKPSAKPMSLTEAWGKFLLQMKARKLSPTSMYKYRLLRKRMQDFAIKEDLHSLKDFNIDVLESFQASWAT